MENQNKSVFGPAMSYGLYLGLALILSQVIFYVSGNPFSQIGVYISHALLLGGISWGMLLFRQKSGAEGMPYGRALGLGTAQAFFSSILLGFFIFILYKFIDTGLLDKFYIYTEQTYLEHGMSEDQVETIMNMSKKAMTPAIMGVSQAFTLTLFGFIFSLILAIFFKRNPEEPFGEVVDEEEQN
ncbi:DUF4199 domain-containing protein [Prolixibacter sp. SD074]|uniref:DUF4199 domain-containing protein n=1 Tax=Prolixibacter sp. SD074 TaxID=2652391 RepID=UPI00188E1E6E|nr:DUF4199 domain-containing protein [Prolixibacter sp. SD074]